MDAFPIGQFLEWVQEFIEKSWGKVWAWVVYSALLLAFIFGAVWVWRVSQLPLQPARVAVARVVAIAPPVSSGTGRPPHQYIVLRAAHATGEFALTSAEVRCKVGQEVQVQQRGIVLTPLPTTCR